MLIHERVNDAPAVDSAQFRVIFEPSDFAEKLVGAARDTTNVVETDLTDVSPPERDWRVMVYVPAGTPEYTATFPVMTGVTFIAVKGVRVNWHPGVTTDQESVAVEPNTLCWKFVGVVGVTVIPVMFEGLLVIPPHTETMLNAYVPQDPRDRVKGGFPILLDAPAAAPVHVRLNCAPAVADAQERVTLLFKLSVPVNDVGGEGATVVDATVLYVVRPQRVAPTWNE